MSLLEILSKSSEEAKQAPSSSAPNPPEEIRPKLVPRALRAKQSGSNSQVKSGKPTATISTLPPKSRAPLVVPPVEVVGPPEGAPSKPGDSIVDELVFLRTMEDRYDPATPNSYYEDVYKVNPSRMVLEKASVSEEASFTTLAPSVGSSESVPISMFAEKLMYKQGWKGSGYGLGKSEQGMATALIGFETLSSGSMKSVGAIGSAPLLRETSRVLLLRNMVLRGQVDATLASETSLECSSFGTVLQCLVLEEPDSHVCGDHEAVRIFVQFSTLAEEELAQKQLHNRGFGGRKVIASTYPEAAFMEKKYWLPLK